MTRSDLSIADMMHHVHLTAEFRLERSLLQVADAVDDKHIDPWIRVVGEKLIQKAFPYTPMEVKITMLHGLSHLSDHLQHRVFAAAVIDPRNLHRLLDFLPTRLHASVLAGIITPEKLLRMPVSVNSIPALEALACLPALPPSLLSFRFEETETYLLQPEKEEIFRFLAKALCHHAGLTSLHLPRRFDTTTTHQLLFPTIATLTALHSLELAHSCTFPEREPTIKQTLQALPQLHSLKVRLSQAYVAPTKRPRDAAAPPRLCLADMLSPATALTSLSLCTPRCCGPRDFFKTAKALSLPQLVQLTTIFSEDAHLAASFFTRLSAPLTSLQLGDELKDPQRIPPAAAPAVQQLLDSLAAFTQLRCFSAALPTDNGGRSNILRTFTTALSTPLAAFRHLQSFTLAAEPMLVHRSVTLLAPVANELTQLRLGIYHPHEHPFPSQNHAFTASWPQFFAAMSQMKLQHLELDWEVHRPVPYGLSSLRPLTQLTFLRLKGWSCLDSPADSQALARMTLLQHLCLDHPCFNDPSSYFTITYDCAAALRQLSALTSLTLKTAEGDSELVAALADEVPSDEYLPALQQLAVSIYDPFCRTHELVGYAAELPALKLLTVHLFPSEHESEPESEPEYFEEDDHERYQHHGHDEARCSPMERLKRAKEDLRTAAAFAGVELEVNVDAYEIV